MSFRKSDDWNARRACAASHKGCASEQYTAKHSVSGVIFLALGVPLRGCLVAAGPACDGDKRLLCLLFRTGERSGPGWLHYR